MLIVTASFGSIKSTISLFNSIPKEIKEKFGLSITLSKLISKYDYLEAHIAGTGSNVPIFYFRYLPQDIQIMIVNHITDDKNLPQYKSSIDKKYKKQRIILTASGLGKMIKHRKWKKLTQSDIENHINELITISEKEGLEIVMNE
jgi:hypothetical protein